MKIVKSMRIVAGITVCIFLFSSFLSGQTYSFKNYGAENNIPSGFIYTLAQADDGFLWVGTGNGLSRFDGYNFYIVQFPDSSELRFAVASLKDRNGVLWFGCNDGSVFYATDNKLNRVPLSNSKSIVDLLEGPDGMIYVIPQGKALYTINSLKPGEIHTYNFPGDPVMFSASFVRGGDLLVGTQENIMICRLSTDSVKVTGVVDGFDYASVTSILQTGDSSSFVIGTEGNGLFRLELSEKKALLTRFKEDDQLRSLNIQSIMCDSEGNLWVSTFGSGVFQLTLSANREAINSVHTYNVKSGLIINDVKTVFQDREGNYWIGSYGEGISMLTSYALGYYTPGNTPVQNNILYVKNFKDKYLLGTPSGFHLFDPATGKSSSYTDLERQVGNVEITSYYLDNENNLWIGTGGNGLFVRNSSGSVKRFYRSGDSGADFVKDIEIENQNIWLATTNGVLVIDRISADEKRRFDINNGLPHNSIDKIMVAKDGNVYIGTESERLYMIDNKFNIIPGNGVMSGSTINKVVSMAQDNNGVIWAATKSNGIFRFRNDSVSALNRSDDLLSNYCYSIFADSGNYIWIGHDKGFSRYNSKKGTMRVFGTDFVKGGACNADGMFESPDHKIFIGTTEGLIIYDRLRDRRSEIAPFTNINYILINDVKYDYQPSFTLPYSKRNIIKVNYTGISFSNPGKVYYSTYLENYDNDWSKLTTSRDASFSLRDGKYKFNLISVNEDGLSQEPAVSFDILIRQPFWRSWWFILSVLAAIAGAVILIIRQRDKAQKKVQEYLENELAARTSVVRQQKAEIELQNMEITDSINYAKRIQTSILPDINKLRESFKDAFILFHPRDIVSGDFYWFDKIENDRFILVCADSTGHGVPGAFMSMIGSTLLQDIVTRKKISKPSEILTLLNTQIFSTLNQNLELGVSNDGMDMVVCEFNIKTRHLRFASAMRPVIAVLEGESYYIKGNRSSIGGESVTEKFFADQEYYLNEGDMIYLFSDGLSDQFGGPDGKKMKIARLKRLIEQVSKLPMSEQHEAISKFYFEWKGNYDQVDDILLMGVRV